MFNDENYIDGKELIDTPKTDKKNRKKILKEIKNENLSLEHLRNIFTNSDISKDDVDEINQVLACGSSERYEELLSLVIEHRHILETKDCPSVKAYCEALKFISYVNSGSELTEAYIKAKAHNRDICVDVMNSNSPSSREELKRLAMIYAKSKLVIRLQASLDYPLHLLFAGYKYQAIEALRKEMNKAPLPKDRIQAADRLLTHLQPQIEQTNNIMINHFGTKEEKNIIETYREALSNYANEKQLLLKDNKDVIDIDEIVNLDIQRIEDD